jgi:alkanesulfonate monooxygenase SsuD/methylene tetrahydromethanopterin reductase-like flavin-dependent oxidoreductase (luciferase family)
MWIDAPSRLALTLRALEHDDRYARAHEFVDIVQRVWDGWEDDAIVGDRDRGAGVLRTAVAGGGHLTSPGG